MENQEARWDVNTKTILMLVRVIPLSALPMLVWLQQLVRIDPESASQLLDVVQRNVADATFDMGNECPMQVGLQGEIFL